jgi:very-short-patch-repair endonuclease
MDRERNETLHIRGKRSTRGVDEAIAAIAAEEHGLITLEELRGLGLGDSAIEHRLARGRLYPVHRGVYAVGYRRLSLQARWLAAVRAAGEGAVLSHEAAADLWGLRASKGRWIDVTVPAKRRAPEGVRIHRTTLAPSEVTKRGPIRVTTPTRTLLDLASQVEERALERALREAIYLRLTTTASLTSCLSTHHGGRGTRALRKLLPDANTGRTRSDLEQDFLTFLRKHKLPPQLNKVIEGFEVDCVWRNQRLVVELDGGAAHDTPHGFENDRARDEQLLAAGWRVMRVTPRRLRRKPEALAAHLRQILGA